ncbi:FAD-dependent oxidoreductase [Amycolatopsis sp. lyj-108]|uniref:FAD-dependent oxidoreductase n=1 Tax=Amycolatopsis sp. lyj-108 TaxID=2789286 RepID=UPI00397A6702
MASVDVTVVVLGAGPAGSVAAAELARAGLDVALVGPPPDATATDTLVSKETAVYAGVDHRSVDLLELAFDQGRRTELTDTGLASCFHDHLVNTLMQKAEDFGIARYTELGAAERIDDGWQVRVGDRTVRARHLIRATGTSGDGSLSAYAQRCSGWSSGDQVFLHLPAPASTGRTGQPTPVRLTPSGIDGQATISVFGGSIETAFGLLVQSRPELAGLRPAGPVHSGTVHTGFTPSAGVQDGALVVGDALGVVNPFTGTGAGTAITTGKLAAAAIVEQATDPALSARTYLQLLNRDVLGHAGPPTQAARRYRLAWRILADTSGMDHPFFAKGRKAILLPDGIRRLGERRRADAGVAVAPFLLSTSEIAVAAVRREWPFVASLIRLETDADQHDVRPALLFAGAALASGKPPKSEWAGIAAAIELAMLGMLALTASEPSGTLAGRGVDWPSATAILAGDFLLAQAARLVARHEPELSGPFADWMADLVAIRARRISEPPDPAASVDFFGCLFEFPARIAAQLADCPEDVVTRLREFGNASGRVFIHVEDLLALRRRRTRLDATLDSLLATRLSSLPSLIPESDDRAVSIEATTAASVRAYEDARLRVGEGLSKRVLDAFLDVLAAPSFAPATHPSQETK